MNNAEEEEEEEEEEERARMLSLVSDWRSSGQTQKAFCANHDVKIGIFSRALTIKWNVCC